MTEQEQRIIDLYRQGVPEAMIVKQLGIKRHLVRTAIVFEQGYRAGLAEADSAASSLPGSAFTAEIEDLVREIMRHMQAGSRVPEKELREKFHVSHTALYKYRAVAADRLHR